MSSVSVKDVLTDIKINLRQVSSSAKDEVRVMQSMLNDTSYEVQVYSKDGVQETYNPAKDFRKMTSNIVAATTKVSKEEAEKLVDGYEVSKSDAATMVNVSKEYVNTYLQTGRKLPFGGRELHSFALSMKEEEAKIKPYPRKTGVDENGKAIYEPGKKEIPAHYGVKVHGSCPSWVK